MAAITRGDLEAAGATLPQDRKGEALAAKAINAAEIHIDNALVGCIYDPESEDFQETRKRAVIAQAIALLDAGIGKSTAQRASELPITSRRLQSASVSYAGADSIATRNQSTLDGQIDSAAMMILRIAGLAPSVSVIG